MPDNIDVFSWSLPFVSEKTMEILFNILLKGFKQCGFDVTDLDIDNAELIHKGVRLYHALHIHNDNSRPFKPDVMKQKLSFIGKLMKMQTNLRQNRELFMLLKGMCPDNKIPKGLLMASTVEIKDAVEHFRRAREMDLVNEQRP